MLLKQSFSIVGWCSASFSGISAVYVATILKPTHNKLCQYWSYSKRRRIQKLRNFLKFNQQRMGEQLLSHNEILHERNNILSGQSESVGSSHVCPAALRGMAFFFASVLCSLSPLASAAFTFSSASGVIVCASLWKSCCAYSLQIQSTQHCNCYNKLATNKLETKYCSPKE